MKLRTQNYSEVAVIELQGDFDEDAVDLFRDTMTGMIEKQTKGIVLDMSAVGFIDSQGLEQLLWARDYSVENDCELRLAGLDENCKKILEITRLENEFDHYAELAQAVKSFA